MAQQIGRTLRKLVPVLSGAILLQAGGCTFDLQGITSGLVTSIAQTLISSFVFGVFGVV